MRPENLFVRPNLVTEPLFNRWYAWSYLVSPASSALYLANQQLRILQSFVSAPQVHAKALQDRKMIGGPFVDHPATKVGEIRALLERTVATRSQALAFAKAVKELHQLLEESADGHSLEPLYSRVPELLRGYVELVYDLNHAPSVRFMEGLLYRSPLFDEAGQSVTMFLAHQDGRPFAFSTPRLPSAAAVDLPIRFADSRLDAFYRAKSEPADYHYLKDLLGVEEQHEEIFSTFFTSQPPVTTRAEHDGVRIRYFGHACVLIETQDVAVLCDPVIGYDYDDGAPRFSYADLPARLDYVLITHNHQDHCALETLLQLRHRIGTVLVPKSNPGALADPSLRMVLRSIGFARVQEVEEMEEVDIDGGVIRCIPFLGEHGDLNIQSKMAFAVELKGRTVVMAADSNNLEPRMYQHIAAALPQVDVLFIGLECEGAPLSWVYGPMLMRTLSRSMDQSRRFDGSDCAKALQVVEVFKPQQAYVYAMGLEPWLTYMLAVDGSETSHSIQESEKFVGLCRERGIESERLYCKKEIVLSARRASIGRHN